nr:O-antigen ligase family protein [uncultured Rhodoferax sp.]
MIFSAVVVFAFGTGLAISKKLQETVVAWIFPIIGAAVVLKTIASKRNVDLYILNPAFAFGEDSGLSVYVLRICMWSILALCGGLIFTKLIAAKKQIFVGKELLISFYVYFLFSTITNSIFGTAPSFDYRIMYSPLLVTALYFGQYATPARLINFSKTTGAISVLLGLIAAAAFPSIAVQNNFVTGWLPWPQIRLWGLDSHANTLGPLAMMVILLEIGHSYTRKWLHLGTILIATITLVLSQSKTAWVSTFIAVVIFFALSTYDKVSARNHLSSRKLVIPIIITISFAIFTALLFAFLLIDLNGMISEFFSTSEGTKLTSMTGRDAIWRITLQEFENNILFGYGPTLWGPGFSAEHRLLGTASNAHNQLIDVLGSSGLFGGVAFLLYLTMLFKYCIKVTHVAGRLPLALLIAMCIRAIPEVPFRLANVLSNDFALHMILLGILFSSIKKQTLLNSSTTHLIHRI